MAEDKTAFLIEYPRVNGRSSYWDGRGEGTFVLDPWDATWFVREQDARRVLDWIVPMSQRGIPLREHCEVVEHGFVENEKNG